jgi:hypothetical protein
MMWWWGLGGSPAHLQTQDVLPAAALAHAVEEVLKDLGGAREPPVGDVVQVARRVLLLPPASAFTDVITCAFCSAHQHVISPGGSHSIKSHVMCPTDAPGTVSSASALRWIPLACKGTNIFLWSSQRGAVQAQEN